MPPVVPTPKADPEPRGGAPAASELVLDAAALAPCLGLTVERYMALWCRGRIRYRVEQGTDEDEGRFRVSLLYRGVRVALIVDAAGAVLAEARPEL